MADLLLRTVGRPSPGAVALEEQQQRQQQRKYLQVREEYLQAGGVTQALRDALRALFAEPRLPSNPYYFLSSVLGAYVDQSPLWKEADGRAVVAPEREDEGGLLVLQPDTALCGHSGTPHAFGLPHVLRLVSRDGVDRLARVLADGVPDTFFPNASPFSTRDGCTVQLLSSVQGMCSVWRPSRTAMPEIQVRTDVLVRGPRLDDCVTVYLDVVLTAVEDVAEVPVHMVDGLTIMDPPSRPVTGTAAPFRQHFPLAAILANVREWEKQARRLVLSGKCIQMRAALLLDMEFLMEQQMGAEEHGKARQSLWMKPATAGGLPITAGSTSTADVAGAAGGPGLSTQYHMATRTFYFHYGGLEESKVGFDQMQHYGCLPHDALYGGYFPTLPAAASYLAMYQVDDRSPPYAPSHLTDNMALLKQQVEQGLRTGNALQACQQLLHLVMLQDADVTGAVHLQQEDLRGLDELVEGAAGVPAGRARPGRPAAPSAPSRVEVLNSQAARAAARHAYSDAAPSRAAAAPQTAPAAIFRVLPNLLRVLSSAAALIQGVTMELEAISIVASSWPEKLASIRTAAGEAGWQQGDKPPSGASRWTLGTPEVSLEMLTWLAAFDLEGRIVALLVGLRSRIRAVVGRGLFAGVSILCEQLLRALPDAANTVHPAAEVAKAQGMLRALAQLLHLGSMTITEGFLGRCTDIVQAMNQLGIQRSVVLGSAAQPAALPGVSATIPPLVGSLPRSGGGGDGDGAGGMNGGGPLSLDVAATAAARARVGALPSRVAVEGVQLQYAVDCHLDEALAAIWAQVSEPPQPLNPFPKLMLLVRSRAAKMELWSQGLDEALAAMSSHLVTDLPHTFIYAALPPQAPGRSTSQSRAGAGAGQEQDDEPRVWGSFAAVSLADPRALQTLAQRLGDLMVARHWQRGAYQGEVIPALVGDCSLSGALKDVGATGTRPPGVPVSKVGSGAPTSLPVLSSLRFCMLEAQQLHLVEGPQRSAAAQAFADEVVRGLQELHASSPHLLHSIQVYLPPGSPATAAIRAVQEKGGTRGSGVRTAASRLPTAATASLVSQPPAWIDAVPDDWGRAGPLCGVGTPPPPILGADGLALEVATLQPPVLLGDAGRELLRNALATAARAVSPGQPLSCVRLFAAPALEPTYLAMRMDFVFQHANVPPPLRPNQAMCAVVGPRPLYRPSTAEQDAMCWDRWVWERVFLERGAAATWWRWNARRGDPAQPAHQQRLVRDVATGVHAALAAGHLLAGHKLALRGAVGVSDAPAIFELSRSGVSASQELEALMDMNHQLLMLMQQPKPLQLGVAGSYQQTPGPSLLHPSSRSKLDNQRLRNMLLSYTSRLMAALRSPAACYFPSLPDMAAPLVAGLLEDVLSSFVLSPRDVRAMEQLAVWCRACQVSVAAALHDSFDPTVRDTWLWGPHTAQEGHGTTGITSTASILRPPSSRPAGGLAPSTA